MPAAVLVMILALQAAMGQEIWFTVDQQGKADFKTVQAALDAVPAEHTGHVTILIRNGTYEEKLFITRSSIALVGESREGTRIVFPQLRSEWVQSHNGND